MRWLFHVTHIGAIALTIAMTATAAVALPWPSDVPVQGPADAPVTILVASEFQCPFCARIGPTLRELVRRHPGQIRLAFGHFPLAFHANAVPAALAAQAAHAQGQFWPFHDALFAAQTQLGDEGYSKIAEQLGLDLARFGRDREDPAQQLAVVRHQNALAAAGVSGTPACFFNGKKLSGAQPIDAFEREFASALADATGMVGGGDPAKLRAVWDKHAPGVGGPLVEWLLMLQTPPPPAQAAASDEPDEAAPKDDPGVWRVDVDPARDAIRDNTAQTLLTVVVFTDLQCPFCVRLGATLEQLAAKYGAKMRMVLKHNPLPFHKLAMPLHRAVLAAGRQGKTWPLYSALMAAGPTPPVEQFEDWLLLRATTAGLDLKRWQADRGDAGLDALIAADLRQGETVGVDGTPTFFINGRRIMGAVPLETIVPVAEQELAKAVAAAGAGHAYYVKAIAAGKKIAPRKAAE